ncbi:MAG: hypothetical protein KKE04_00335, partial [Candidatus Thermoplasmatota archaeon]|nr:hypothetical protein [Candidatus Thermoplasmatota archaeon]
MMKMGEEYWKKWEEKGVIKDMRKELREDFSGAEVKLKIEKKPLEKKKEEKEEKKTEEKKESKWKPLLSGMLLGAGVFLIFTLPYKLIIKECFSHYYLMACIIGLVLAGAGAYIIPKKQKIVILGIGITLFIICVL